LALDRLCREEPTISLVADPATLPSIADAWSRVQAAREEAYEAPWSHAILRVLELDGFKAKGKLAERRIAERLDLRLLEVARCPCGCCAAATTWLFYGQKIRSGYREARL